MYQGMTLYSKQSLRQPSPTRGQFWVSFVAFLITNLFFANLTVERMITSVPAGATELQHAGRIVVSKVPGSHFRGIDL
jgi:hypothetical protein